jgi:hypothetical protein
VDAFVMHQETGVGSTARPFIFSLGVENPAGVFTSYEFMRMMDSPDLGNVAFGVGATTGRSVIQLHVTNVGAPGQRDSHSLMWRGKANDGSEHSVDWLALTDVTSNAGASQWTLKNSLDSGVATGTLTFDDTGLLAIASTAPQFKMTDTTAAAKSLILKTDANVSSFYEAAGAVGDILSLDLTNKRVGIGTASPTGPLDVSPAGARQLLVTSTANAVNYVQITGAATGNNPAISAQGSDTNVSVDITSKGTGIIRFITNAVAAFIIRASTTPVNRLEIQNTDTGVPLPISAVGTDTDISIGITPKGAGTVNLNTNVYFTNKIIKYNSSDPTDGQLLIGKTSTKTFEATTLTAGTGISITNGAGTITVAAAVGAGAWTLISSGSPSGGKYVQTDLGGYSDIRVLVKGVTKSAGAVGNILVSTDNGSTYKTASGDYVYYDVSAAETNGTDIAWENGSTTGARSAEIQFFGFNLSAPHTFFQPNKAVDVNGAAVPADFFGAGYVSTTSALNALKVTTRSGDVLNGGTIYVFGR